MDSIMGFLVASHHKPLLKNPHRLTSPVFSVSVWIFAHIPVKHRFWTFYGYPGTLTGYMSFLSHAMTFCLMYCFDTVYYFRHSHINLIYYVRCDMLCTDLVQWIVLRRFFLRPG